MLKQGSTYKCHCGAQFYTSIDTEMHVQQCTALTAAQRAALIFELNPLTLPVEVMEAHATPSIGMGEAPKAEIIPATLGDSPYDFTEAGEQMIEELLIAAINPKITVQLDGPSGMGKSVVVREVARRLHKDAMAINAHPGMDIGLLVGQMFPRATEHGMTLVWEDGDLTKAIKEGIIFFFEEATRAPQEMVSRLFGLLDQGFGYFNLPEAGVRDVPIHDDFWMVLTSNPAGAGYQTSRLDTAFQSRMGMVLEVNEPLADERKVLTRLLAPNNEQLGHAIVDRFLHFAFDTRRKDANGFDRGVNTRDLIYAATLQARGFSACRAIEVSIGNKDMINKPAIMQHANHHFLTNHDYAAEAAALVQELNTQANYDNNNGNSSGVN
jgi:nitric oxide reductase NorQ protein